MDKSQRKGLFLFHRDLRIVDNRGLNQASRDVAKLYTCFIFTPEQVTSKNSYKSTNSVQFMLESLESLSSEIRDSHGELLIMYGSTVNTLEEMIDALHINCLYFNRDYTPYARARDEAIEKMCVKKGIECKIQDDDYYLYIPGTVVSKQGSVYQKFTPFYDEVLLHDVEHPSHASVQNLAKYTGKKLHPFALRDGWAKFVGEPNAKIAVHGGRTEGTTRLRNSVSRLKDYDDTRDEMSQETSRLSAYLKYGCVSIREAFHAFKLRYALHSSFIRQLIWRDFFAHLLFAYPNTLSNIYNEDFGNIRWVKNNKWLESWKNGMTGFPLVDAGMRELNETGYMHNRARMLVATFLTKIMHIDWKDGERYFAQKLVDYDVASNLGNWASIVGGGAYSMPWFRVMSPWEQSKKHDADAIYIKKWVPELKDVPPKNIHKWYNTSGQYSDVKYPAPILDYKKQKDLFLKMVKSVF